MANDGYNDADGGYVKDHNGEVFASESMGNAIKAERAKAAAAGGGGFIGGLVGSPIVGLAFAAMIILLAVGVILRRFGMYFIAIGLALLFRLAFLFLQRFIPPLRRIPLLVVNLASILVLVIGLLSSFAHYASSLDPALLDNERIVAQSDGRPVSIHKNPDLNEKVIGTVEAGVNVKIFGITRDRDFFKIETPDGIVGFVQVSALPARARPGDWSLMRGMMGMETAGREEYTAEQARENANAAADALMPNIHTVMIPVGISSEPKDKGSGGMDWGWVTVHGVGYLNEYTIVQIEHGLYSLDNIDIPTYVGMHGGATTGTYYITPLDSQNSETFGLVANRPYTLADGKVGQYLFFQPFKTRHFNLLLNQRYGGFDEDSGENVRNIIVPDTAPGMAAVSLIAQPAPIQAATAEETTALGRFAVGDTVFAEWSNNEYYLAEVTIIRGDGSTEVRFYDGNRRSNIRLARFEDLVQTHNTKGNGYIGSSGELTILSHDGGNVEVKWYDGSIETLPREFIVFTTQK